MNERGRTSEEADSHGVGDPIRFGSASRFKALVMSRQQVSFEQLFALLDGEYGKVRSAECRACVTPLPMRRTPADEVSSNWFVVNPVECPHRCNVILAEIVTRMMSEYELGRSEFGAAQVVPRKRIVS